MKARAIATLAFLALTTAFAPLAAMPATGTTESYDLNTRQYDDISAGEYDGRMRLRISPDGIVSGTFMDTQGGITDVTGGLDGTKIWLQIGNSSHIGRNYYSGTFVDGKLKGVAPTMNLHRWTIEGKPIAP
jgi:hypothetical protein